MYLSGRKNKYIYLPIDIKCSSVYTFVSTAQNNVMKNHDRDYAPLHISNAQRCKEILYHLMKK
jgi:hypothetical protein